VELVRLASLASTDRGEDVGSGERLVRDDEAAAHQHLLNS
jgi:hypothetical protein